MLFITPSVLSQILDEMDEVCRFIDSSGSDSDRFKFYQDAVK